MVLTLLRTLGIAADTSAVCSLTVEDAVGAGA
jgi:hypothetical protein